MHRHNRETTSPETIEAILSRATWCTVSMVTPQGTPYAVPLNYGHQGTTLYAHCALRGTKLDILRHNLRVWVTVVSNAVFYDGGPDAGACKAGTFFSSLMASGTAQIITAEDERLHAMHCLLQQFGIADRPLGDAMRVTTLIRIDLGDITTKERPAP
jgi:nitroimidazol reductase NimA-like FMN-containing flavoprotein (pyridoxamine 5'-phosphate oxidase superfamily)